MALTETRGRRRREKRLFVEANGPQFRYYRQAPEDLKQALGIQSWVHKFAQNSTDAEIDEMSMALAEYHDKIIEQTRNTLKLLQEAREKRAVGEVERV